MFFSKTIYSNFCLCYDNKKIFRELLTVNKTYYNVLFKNKVFFHKIINETIRSISKKKAFFKENKSFAYMNYLYLFQITKIFVYNDNNLYSDLNNDGFIDKSIFIKEFNEGAERYELVYNTNHVKNLLKIMLYLKNSGFILEKQEKIKIDARFITKTY